MSCYLELKMAPSLSQLSPEVLEEIFKHLSPGDLCSLAFTSRKISQAACNPEFFCRLGVPGEYDWFKKKIVDRGMSEFLEQRRLQKIWHLDLFSTSLPPEDYNLLVDHIVNGGLQRLVVMQLGDVVLSGVEANSLGQAVVKVWAVEVPRTQLTVQQCQLIMENIVTVRPKLKDCLLYTSPSPRD